MSRLYLITGYPGVGKYTVASALRDRIEARNEPVRLVDNHWIANPIFGLVQQDGLTPLPDAVWSHVYEVAKAVIGTVRDVTPPEWQVIFTSYLDPNDDLDVVEWLAEVAGARGNLFVPVRLTCERSEHERRIVEPSRRDRMKSIEPDLPARLAELAEPRLPDHANALSVDVTAMPPADVAALIEHHTDRIAAR